MFNKRGKAFECDKCPKNNNPELGNFCPAWWEQAWTEQGQEIIKKDCAFRLLPNMMVVLGATSRLSMTTAQEMNKRLDAVDNMCKNVTGKMEGLAKAFYIAAQRAEYLSKGNQTSDYIERTGQHDLRISGGNEDGNYGDQRALGPECGGAPRGPEQTGPDADVYPGESYRFDRSGTQTGSDGATE